MKVLYGYDNTHYINITADVFKKCLKDDGIHIPAGDGNRCDIIGYDPYPNILKHIMIFDHKDNSYMYTHTKEFIIHINCQGLGFGSFPANATEQPLSHRPCPTTCAPARWSSCHAQGIPRHAEPTPACGSRCTGRGRGRAQVRPHSDQARACQARGEQTEEAQACVTSLSNKEPH